MTPFAEAKSAAVPPLILTLRFDAAAFDAIDGLRRRHFPAARNRVPAHATLFHHLPGEHESAVRERLREVAGRTATFDLSVSRPRFLGMGVALDVDAPTLRRLRAELADGWADWLGRQDGQAYRPHVTIQNKVDPPVARRLYETLRGEWEPLAGRGEGLLLWRYLGGPWEAVEAFRFGPGAAVKMRAD